MLTGPGNTRLTARKMLACPWLVPRGNPVLHLDHFLSSMNVMCSFFNSTSLKITEVDMDSHFLIQLHFLASVTS